jgi:hypothetical protein
MQTRLASGNRLAMPNSREVTPVDPIAHKRRQLGQEDTIRVIVLEQTRTEIAKADLWAASWRQCGSH